MRSKTFFFVFLIPMNRVYTPFKDMSCYRLATGQLEEPMQFTPETKQITQKQEPETHRAMGQISHLSRMARLEQPLFSAR